MAKSQRSRSGAQRTALHARTWARHHEDGSMAFNELETRRIERALDAFVQRRRPPPHIRHELDIGYRLSRQSVEVFEIRPVWGRPTETMEYPVAKATFVATAGVWKVFWQRADLKWHSYAPVPAVGSIEKFLELVEKDPLGCFWG